MAGKEYEAANLLLPITNTKQVKAGANFLASPTTQVAYIPSLFGNYDQHFYTLQADGADCYVALSPIPTGVIDPGAQAASTGLPTAFCWKIPDGQQEHGVLIGHTPLGTGPVPTQGAYFLPHHLLYRLGSGAGSGWLRIRRSSVQEGGGQDEFFPPGYKRRHNRGT